LWRARNKLLRASSNIEPRLASSASWRTTNEKYPTRGGVFFMVTLIEANWNLICEEIIRWIELLKGVQGSLALPRAV